MATSGIVLHVPNDRPRFVPISVDVLSLCTSQISGAVRLAVRAALGYDEEVDGEDFRLLFRERDLEEERSATAFLKAFGAGAPCTLRLLFRLLGGKGGFGALLRGQKGKGKKTTNFDASRDLTGRRIRHSKAVERIKEWMEKKKADDELVKLITGEGPELPKAPGVAETLDPEYVKRLKRVAADRPNLVSEGLRKLIEEEEAASVEASAAGSSITASHVVSAELAKRARTGSAPTAGEPKEWLSALSSLGPLSSSEGESESDRSDADADAARGSGEAGSSSSAAAESGVAVVAEASAATESNGANPSASAAGNGMAEDESSDGEVSAPKADEPEEDEPEVEQDEKQDEEKSEVKEAEHVNEEEKPAAPPECSMHQKRDMAKSAVVETAAIEPDQLIGAGDVATFSSVEELQKAVSAEVLKRSLQQLGMKCGGTPQERAKRLFMLKATPLKDLPKAVLAPKR
mmetsp:Transcript_89575/g.252464  ORF Transcript_89575/g.252464 Transcript_89575/m.252464 type:complete len:461 (-) Transcript_89575:138-1520(-)